MIDCVTNPKYKKWRCLLPVILLACISSLNAQTEKLRVGFLTGAPSDNPFWSQMAQVMQAVANDLNIELIVKYDPAQSTYSTKKIGSRLLDSEPGLDYLITKFWLSVTAAHIEQAEQHGTRVFVINSDVPESEYEAAGRLPRQKHDNWIGHMVPDDEKAGYGLAGTLIQQAKQNSGYNRTDKIHIMGLNAPYESTVGNSRCAGLKNRAAQSPDVELQKIDTVNWETGSAGQAITDLLKVYPDTDIIWSPNQAIALGALHAVERSGKIPGKDIQIGGFDWNPESLQAIADGRIGASMFGHFLEGAWALILVHDYHHGIDFANEPGVRSSTPLNIINADNYEQFKVLLQKAGWEAIDFKQFSKKYNQELKTYNFNINQFIK